MLYVCYGGADFVLPLPEHETVRTVFYLRVRTGDLFQSMAALTQTVRDFFLKRSANSISRYMFSNLIGI
jgi:hypothetical protein